MPFSKHSEVRRREEDSEQTTTSYEEEGEGRLAATIFLPFSQTYPNVIW